MVIYYEMPKLIVTYCNCYPYHMAIYSDMTDLKITQS